MSFAVTVGICFTAVIILLLLYVLPMFFMHPLDSGKIDGTDIMAIKNRSNNLFFISLDEDWIVIDAGSDAKSVKQEMEKMGIDGNKVKGVFLTHTDYDHVASIPLFPNAAIYEQTGRADDRWEHEQTVCEEKQAARIKKF